MQTESASVVGRAGRRPNREEYAPIREGGFQSVQRRPLSTFSVDVDTAAYSNLRRFLRDGSLPPPDSVRIEEMLNYFRYSYPEPDRAAPVAIRAEMAECPWERGNLLLHIGLRARSIPTDKLPPANLVFLIDVSGSMLADNKLPLLKRSFALLVEQLRPRDSAAIVVYAGAAGLVLPPTGGSRKDVILGALGALQAGGSTAGGAGIRLAYRIARESFIDGGNNRVILATDGDFNVGESSDDAMVRLIEDERRHGVFLTVLGYGMGNLKDSKLEKLADHGNGNYAYIDSLSEARKVLVQQMGATLNTVAKDVKLQVEFDRSRIAEWRLVGYENRRLRDRDFRDDTKDAGDMGSGHTVTALYELVPARKAGPGRALTVRMRYKPPAGDKASEFELPVDLARTRIDSASEDLRFAAGVAEFGMLLRGSAHRGGATHESAIRLVQGALGEDPDGRRAELLYLVKTARDLYGAISQSNDTRRIRSRFSRPTLESPAQ
jgi:Ca-activated chloride channel family protein